MLHYQGHTKIARTLGAKPVAVPNGGRRRATFKRNFCVGLLWALLWGAAVAQTDLGRYEGRAISDIEITFENTPPDEATARELRAIMRLAPRSEYRAVRVREALQRIFDSELIAAAQVEVRPVSEAANAPVLVRFAVRRPKRVSEIAFDVALPRNSPVTEDALRSRITALEPGGRVSEKLLGDNADAIQEYLRERGFFRAEVTASRQVDVRDTTGIRERVVFQINLGTQATVSQFDVAIDGFDAEKLARVRRSFKLKEGSPYTREAFANDVEKLRKALIENGFLAPVVNDAQPVYDSSNNTIRLSVVGRVGPNVEVTVTDFKLSKSEQRELLPVNREGIVDISTIVEGQRRLRNKLQLDGYFFAEVNYACTAVPELADNSIPNNTEQLCALLNPEDIGSRKITVNYLVDEGRQFTLSDIRIVGADNLPLPELPLSVIEPELRTQRANPLSFFNILGSRRGYTTEQLLAQDRRLIQTRLADLGYREAKVSARRGVSNTGDNDQLIITFAVTKGRLTRVAGVEFAGNTVFNSDDLRAAIARRGRERCAEREAALLAGRSVEELPCYPTITGAPYSRSQARADGDAVQKLYADAGYFDARVEFSVDEATAPTTDEQAVKLTYTVRNEGKKVYINDIVVTGNERTKRAAILRAVPLKRGDLLRAEKLTISERNLYTTDSFRQINIRTRAVGENPDGSQLRDVVIEVEEDKTRTLEYGGGFSTDTGPFGFVGVRYANLFGKLQQGGARIRASRQQQLVRLDFLDPRWRPYSQDRFMPLSISAQYQRDSTVTRFFRSTVDKGSFGIVQRLDANGDPIDELGRKTGDPTINRFTLNIETRRTLDLKERNIVLLRYAYEDVRLYNINSLLIADFLRPDRRVRLSRLGGTFFRDTRDSQQDSSKGEFLSFNYDLSLRALGANISFSKLQLDYRRYYRVAALRNTILAGNVTLGLASVISPRDRDGNGTVDDLDRQLPISERFFGGGSTSLRGFDFEEAGPRLIAPTCYLSNDPTVLRNCGVFRNRRGELVTLNPFTVPVGGNGLAVVNLEARVPLQKAFQIVPFYDGGNVYRNARDIFGGKSSDNPNLQMRWTHTVGLGFRVKTPIGGSLAVDYAYMLNPPQFIIPQVPLTNPDAIYRLPRTQIHFRFTQTF